MWNKKKELIFKTALGDVLYSQELHDKQDIVCTLFFACVVLLWWYYHTYSCLHISFFVYFLFDFQQHNIVNKKFFFVCRCPWHVWITCTYICELIRHINRSCSRSLIIFIFDKFRWRLKSHLNDKIYQWHGLLATLKFWLWTIIFKSTTLISLTSPENH